MIATSSAPIAISYRPKENDYLPVVVSAIRRFLGDWPIALLCEERHRPATAWLERFGVQAITDWNHSSNPNKVLRLWEHQRVFSEHFDRWIWWHDDMILLKPLSNPEHTFERPVVAKRERTRPNKKLSNWHCWLWDTLTFFQAQGIPAPNPVLHIPRLIRRDVLASIPEDWDESRLLFEPTYLLLHWHRAGQTPIVAPESRQVAFTGELPGLAQLEADEDANILAFGRKIDHESARRELGCRYPLDFDLRQIA